MINRYKLICCDVLFRMACLAAARSRNVVDMAFTKLQSHNEPDALRKEIQELIDGAESGGQYAAVLLGYGLCGNSTAGLKARGLPLVIPRAHDCCTLFLGSRGKFAECFGERLSAQWSSHGYLERSKTYSGGVDYDKNLGIGREYASLVEQYGEENAEYIWETLHPAHNIGKDERIYIDVAPFDGAESGDFHYLRYLNAVKEEAASGEAPHAAAAAPAAASAAAPLASASASAAAPLASTAAPANAPYASTAAPATASPGAPAAAPAGSQPASASASAAAPDPVIRRLEGSTRLIDKLLDGEWDDEFLIVPPGMEIMPVYDMEQVITCGASKPAGR